MVSNSFISSLFIYVILLILLFVFIPTLFIPTFSNINYIPSSGSSFPIFQNSFLWPIPGYTKVTSPFGNRVSPTNGASFYHEGVDIGASAGSTLLAIHDGIVVFTGFSGSGGYTITYSFNEYLVSYCHISPNLLLPTGTLIKKGDIIGYVGPKNVYSVPNNPYKDSNGNPTNGATTGPHLHFSIKKNGTAIDPFVLYTDI